ncbi:MAG: primosomal protein N' [Sphingomonadaceae bacterium]|uniref:primosomal protein N' n=1 Tax=Thermaurantiacus sp. TaxID=2820283 RepID=UPI00298EF0F1|nr:primosomal protein N' [Thermaurantiacus sp.]MCS6987239.1 primosomal protein N' [Sphingomonadaceae bacterium]MDW8414459.1 primosomal protein N' [Thermaurantiacus sp.]
MAGRVAVVVAGAPLGPLDYAGPEEPPLAPGDVVEVPLGRRRAVGVVWDAPPQAHNRPLRTIHRRLDVPPMSRALRQTLEFLADWYLAPLGQALRLALPRAALASPKAAPLRLVVAAQGPAPPQALGDLGLRLWAHAGAPADTAAGWARRLGVSPGRVARLVAQGLLVEASVSWPRELPPGPLLSPAQAAAAHALRQAVGAGFQAFLLDGVTGSGKTEVYLEAVAQTIAAGRQALVLLPEIALTAPFLARFRARFGFAPLTWHSGLGDAERRRTFAGLARGEAPVVVGARSALFLPLARPGLLVVDEAHDPSFKQEDGLPYHARDMAVVRARAEGVPVVLASATPSLETLEQAARGRYRHLVLPDRHGPARLPEVRLVDLKRTPPPRGRWLSPPLVEAVSQALSRGEQALLFLNRRGYAPLTLCRACGARIRCPHCTAWMVDHRLQGVLLCHHCGHAMARPPACPTCGAEGQLVPCGPGVERVAEEAAARWPDARLRIVTSDTVRSPREAEELVAAVRARAVDLLVGTQMLAKAHDFPDLTVVGVVDADLGLQGGDLRAAERTFQQVAQVAGRAGRSDKPGLVLVQTHEPDSPLLQAVAAHDRDGFVAAERSARAAAGMPPFTRLAAVVVSAAQEEAAQAFARALALAAPAHPAVDLFGPAPAPLAVLKGRHRLRFLVRARRGARLQDWLRAWLGAVRPQGGVRITVDVDPQSFL